MKKIDKLILSSFLGPFVITFLVVVFILLNIHMLKYFDDIIGKDLEWITFAHLFFYFAIFNTPIAMPLAVLLSSLIAFGNLGEHFELTAVKSAGISLIRTLRPIFIFVVFLTAFAFYVNNSLVPKAALEAYSLLYDIKQKKPALDLREGAFYGGIPDISIKVNEKLPDDIGLKDIIIYDHRKRDGNKEVTVADSGRMYTILNEQYLKLELYDGYNYTEGAGTEQEMTGRKSRSNITETFSRSKFKKTQVVFDLSSFSLQRTDKKWFQGNRIMRNLSELEIDIDSIEDEILEQKLNLFANQPSYFNYFRQDSIIYPPSVYRYKIERDSLYELTRQKDVETDDNDTTGAITALVDPTPPKERLGASERTLPSQRRRGPVATRDTPTDIAISEDPPMIDRQRKDLTKRSDNLQKIDSLLAVAPGRELYGNAAARARSAKSLIVSANSSLANEVEDLIIFQIQWHKILSISLTCMAMFFIGAPLGSIIKRGGLGVPFLVSILFFIIFYLLSMTGEKWAKQGLIPVQVGVWAADVILLIIGLFFLRQARNDARLFEGDFYMVAFDKVKEWLIRRKIIAKPVPQ